MQGLDTAAVLAAVNAAAQADADRDAALRDLVAQAAAGTLSAQDVVDELARRLAAPGA